MKRGILISFGKASLLFLLVFLIKSAEAKVTLPSVFTDHMVLQQQANVKIWGKSRAEMPISIKVGWNDQEYKGKSDAQGNWEITVKTPSYGGPFTLKISDGEELVLNDILIGEVWICSGQSNMEMPLSGWGKITNYQQEIADANYPQIRLLQAEKVTSNFPLDNAKIEGQSWKVCSPENISGFSSVAYFFAREIYKKTNIPVGLIHTSWGGTIAEAWVSSSSLKTMPYFIDAVKKIENYKKEENELPYEKQLADWHQNSLASDKGLENKIPLWTVNGLNVTDWQDITLPSLWEDKALPDFDGVVWFRKDVTISKENEGKDLILNLETIDDDDVTYFNGEKIGETMGYNLSRNYTIPGRLVKNGINTITVRVFDGTGGGGIYGEPGMLYIKDQIGDKISLDGVWKYKVGYNLKDLKPLPTLQTSPNRPTVLYNAMIHPFINFTIKGAIWYQGESNAGRSTQYRELFPLLIKDWRSKWNIGDFPFYYVQLANYMSKDAEPVNSDWANLRDAQKQTLALANTGMAVTIDIGDAKDIHPKNKQDVGKRLALIALNKNYGQKEEYSGPVLSSHKVVNNKIVLSFNHAKGLKAKGADGKLTGFAIAGTDGKYHWADAIIKGNIIEVSSADVAKPVSVRYAWANNPDANLYNSNDLPASPFSTAKEH